jgi:hypothetical protein
MIAELMIFYKGAISYQDFMSMSFPEFMQWRQRAIKINDEYNKEMMKQQKS